MGEHDALRDAAAAPTRHLSRGLFAPAANGGDVRVDAPDSVQARVSNGNGGFSILLVAGCLWVNPK
eukprot:CAMPEP_0181191776 /NCGR_PEP_ID=MMETSP1096-20121128/12914_1 /TAXON_ID=156174 ORGANISM="Chrysochromulina ericina, Strain CCMP281" /NCGR_SAMPLE_ID=MMETSP1096 /ASSEMBLY_ACC=CAM_ASM_000453 /LENGTH=65 /DNA_ID=CAMNT_0023281095 /DNA_START=283 /DNA_END=480 /DNA_ORIENTATION=+